MGNTKTIKISSLFKNNFFLEFLLESIGETPDLKGKTRGVNILIEFYF